MSPNNIPGGVEVGPVAHDVMGCISSTFSVNHALATVKKYFLYTIFLFGFIALYITKLLNSAIFIIYNAACLVYLVVFRMID